MEDVEVEDAAEEASETIEFEYNAVCQLSSLIGQVQVRLAAAKLPLALEEIHTVLELQTVVVALLEGSDRLNSTVLPTCAVHPARRCGVANTDR